MPEPDPAQRAGTEQPYPLRKGQVFCVLTSLGDAQTKGETRKLVVISVSGISDDREVSLLAAAYIVPR